MILIFSGTTEGRMLSERLSRQGIPCTVCVATDYGSAVMHRHENVKILTGRLNRAEMLKLMKGEGFDCVVDATHPFAAKVSEEIKAACGSADLPYLRLKRETGTEVAGTPAMHFTDSMREAAEYLSEQTKGYILVTTGSKDLAVLTEHFRDRSRLFVRVLPMQESLSVCEKCGIEPGHIIAMQGPFSEEANIAFLRQTGAKTLLTKETGAAGGYAEKLSAAFACKAEAVIIRNPENGRPEKEAGENYSYTGILRRIKEITGKETGEKREIFLCGLGPGGEAWALKSFREISEEAEVVFGAKGVLETARSFLRIRETLCIPEYRPEKILSYLKEHSRIRKAAVLFSGDTGFYSGASAVREELERDGGFLIETVPGVSSVSCLSAKLGIPWEDWKLCSMHGRKLDYLKEIRENEKVFLLLSSVDEVRRVGEELKRAFREKRLRKMRIFFGYELSRETERFGETDADELTGFTEPGLYVLLFIREGGLRSEQPGSKRSGSEVFIPRLMISAPGSGSGKTILTTGLLKLIERSGRSAAAFKCGPDYIDPMFHREVLEVPSVNLDTWFSDELQIKKLFLSHTDHKDLAVIEGAMGYTDGLGGTELQASSADLAEKLDVPVIFCINAKGMSRSIVPLIKGYLDYDGGRRIRGVILNRVSGSAYKILRSDIERELPVRVLGYIPENEAFHLESRYLGLIQAQEIRDIKRQIEKIADLLSETLETDQIIKIAEEAEPLYAEDKEKIPVRDPEPVRIGVASDEAFSFVYEDNLDILREEGAEIIPFSPLHDPFVPEADGLIFIGGFPELYAKELSENESMKESVRQAAKRNMPILAECGGFMYLLKELQTEEGVAYPMTGILTGRAFHAGRLTRFGYAEYRENGPAEWIPDGGKIRGHEFHYYESSENGEAFSAVKPVSRKRWSCMRREGNILAGFPHLYYRSEPSFAEGFLNRCRKWKTEQSAVQI